jgi:hypothetical protein
LEAIGAAEAVDRNARKAAISVNRVLTGRIPRATTRTVGACFLIDHLSGLGGRLVGNDQAKIADGSRENNYRGMVTERRRLSAVPTAGSYIIGPGAKGRLWHVAAVVVDGDQVGVYCVEVSAMLTSELTAMWATWGESGGSGRQSPPGRECRPWAWG